VKASDLRIGNYVQDNDGNIEQVWSLQIIFIIDKVNNEPHEGFYKPIAINTDWLLRFGFQLTRSGYRRGDYTIKPVLGYPMEMFDIYEIAEQDEYYIKTIFFVHDLQNGWHWLTGEELTIKDT